MDAELSIRLDAVNDDISLLQKKQGLTFGTDALLLASYIEGKYDRALELGAGTGVISLLLLKREKARQVTALEVQADFAEIIRKNAVRNDVSDALDSICIDLRDFSCEKKYPLVFTNPPYMRCDSGKANVYDEKNIARHEVKGTIFDFCKCASRSLKFGGSFYAVYRTDRMADLICAMRECKIEPKRITFVHADENSPPSMLLIEGKCGAAPSMRVTPPLILYKDSAHKTYSEDYEYIYQNGRFSEKFQIRNARKTPKEVLDGTGKKQN